MPELANIRHERFAQGVVNGLTGAEAYRRVADSNSKIPAAPTPRLRHVLAGQGVHRTEFVEISTLDAIAKACGVDAPYLLPAVRPLPQREPLSVSKAPADGARLADPVGKGRHGEIHGRRTRVRGTLPLFPGFQIRAPAVAVLNAD
jgi:hypothetical protein